jgi:hypothetical protein
LLKSKSKESSERSGRGSAPVCAGAQQAVLSAQELVGHEHRHQIDRREFLGLGVSQSGFEESRHATGISPRRAADLAAA